MDLDKIGGMSQGDLRRFIVNLLQSDPGALPRHLSSSETLPSPPHTDGDVPVWDAATNKWLPASQHKIPATNLANGILESQLTLTHYVFNRVVMLTSGTSFTPTAGTRALYVECVGGGGAGGGAAITVAGQYSVAGGGGSGGYSAAWLTANLAGACTIAIGAAGVGGTGNGGNGGATSFKDTTATTKCLANGGTGGTAGIVESVPDIQSGGIGAVTAGGVGDFIMPGSQGGNGYGVTVTAFATGAGASGPLGGAGGGASGKSASSNGNAAGTNTGAGGGGASNAASQGTTKNGGNGGSGVIRVWEFF